MDTPTASLALAITQLCISIIMVGVYFAAPTERYTRLWAQFGICSAAGLTLIIFSAGGQPGMLLIIGNVLLFSACVLVWAGMRAFYGRRTGHSGYALCLAFTIGYTLLIGFEATFAHRLLFSSASLILVFLLCLQTLLVRADDGSSQRHAYARRMAIAGLCLLLTGHGARLVMLTAQTAVTTPDDFSQLNVVLVYLLPLAGTVLFFPALLLLYFERIKDQLLLSLDARQDALETQTRFVEMFSHEYRTPLAIIRTNLDILHNKLRGASTTTQPNLEKMQRAVGRLVEVAETAVCSDPREDGKIGPIRELFNISELLRNIAGEAAEFWSEKNPQIELDSAHEYSVSGDRALLKTALLNLLDNAIKYGPAGGQVRIQMGSQGDSLRIQISDQGPGIPEHELDLVYGKYYRGSRTRLVSGSGMGLYLVLRIVSQHAGGVGLANRPEGGTVVTITLPLPAQENAV
ncbi:sensor histidine kinase [Pseudoduganella danionis]|uniref:sensor histidine kinase n=1 Tax=Pseudoduganella danionis TaxID=1890295 RepID=UPI0035AF98ED